MLPYTPAGTAVLQIGASRGKNPGLHQSRCQQRTLRVDLLTLRIDPTFPAILIQTRTWDIGVIDGIAIDDLVVTAPPASTAYGFPVRIH